MIQIWLNSLSQKRKENMLRILANRSSKILNLQTRSHNIQRRFQDHPSIIRVKEIQRRIGNRAQVIRILDRMVSAWDNKMKIWIQTWPVLSFQSKLFPRIRQRDFLTSRFRLSSAKITDRSRVNNSSENYKLSVKTNKWVDKLWKKTYVVLLLVG